VLKGVLAQDKLNQDETSTAGYQMLDLRMSKELRLAKGQQLTISLFGKNLLDEVARNHTSFVKDEVPLAGRNIGLKVSLSL
jgi:iron complex outermembrane receptor protein